MPKIYVGVDPGVTGAVAFLQDGDTRIADIPVLTVPNGNRKETMIDARELASMIQNTILSMNHDYQLIPNKYEIIVVLEKTQPMKDSAMTAFSMGQTRGIIIAVAALMEIPIINVTPQKWKKHFGLLNCEKDASRTLAMERFPLLRDQLRRKKDHDRAEAVLIALYGKELNL